MKGLVIENQYTVDIEVVRLLADLPNLFSEVKELLTAKYIDTVELVNEIVNTDAIIVASTWTDNYQIKELINAFINPKFPKPLKLYLSADVITTINEWLHKKDGWDYKEKKELGELAVKLFNSKHELFVFDDTGEYITDDLNKFDLQEHKRSKKQIHNMFFSKDDNVFYSDSPDYQLNYMKKHFK